VQGMARHSAMMCFLDSAERMKRATANKALLDNVEKNVILLKNNAHSKELKSLFQQFEKALNAQKEAGVDFMSAVNSGNMDLAKQIRTTYMQETINNIISTAQQMEKYTKDASNNYCLVVSTEMTKSVISTLTITIVIAIILLVSIAIAIIMAIIKPLKKAVRAADKISHGDFGVDLKTNSKDETGLLMKSMEGMVSSLDNMSKDVKGLIHNAVEGKLKERADANKHEGNFQEIVEGMNELVDAFVDPITTTAKFLADVAVGSADLQKVTKEYKGDFNDIKNNINIVHSTLLTILDEFSSLSENAKAGNLSERANVSKVKGA
jgi:methyl-accepting chemotaxis protein